MANINFVTGETTTKPPQVSKEIAFFLKENYQPRCWDPLKESEAHHHYFRGMVDLAEYLIAAHEQGMHPDTGLDVDSENSQEQ